MKKTATKRDGPDISNAGRRFLAAPGIAEFLEIWLTSNLLEGEPARTFDHYYGSYRKSFSPRIKRFYANQIPEVEELAMERQGLRFLEVGCGLGTESLWLTLKGGLVTAIDVRDDRIAAAEARKSILERETNSELGCEFQCESLLDLKEIEPFDVIWMEQAFHHLEPRDEIIRKTAGLLRPGGYLVISEANALNPVLQMELLFRRGLPRVETQEGPDGRLHSYGVERITTAQAIRRAFERVHVRCVGVRHFRMFPNRPFFDRFAGLEARLAVNPLAPVLTHFNYVGQRAA